MTNAQNSKAADLRLSKSLELLITVGREIERGIQPSKYTQIMIELQEYDFVNRVGVVKHWQPLVHNIEDDDLVTLIRGMVYAERVFKWSGGSAAAAIWLCKILLDRGVPIEVTDGLAEWILVNTENPYVPFGTQFRLGARNFTDYKTRSLRRRVLRAAAEQEIREEATELRSTIQSARDNSVRDRKSAARSELITRLNKMTVIEQLKEIGTCETYLPNFYPTRCADAADLEVIRALPRELAAVLYRKLTGRQRGPWRAFKKRLAAVVGPPKGRERLKL